MEETQKQTILTLVASPARTKVLAVAPEENLVGNVSFQEEKEKQGGFLTHNLPRPSPTSPKGATNHKIRPKLKTSQNL